MFRGFGLCGFGAFLGFEFAGLVRVWTAISGFDLRIFYLGGLD